ANSLVNALLEQPGVDPGSELSRLLGCLVLDELHLLGDSQRGYLLEVLVAKVRYFAPTCQIVGMSATLPNVSEVAAWLDASLYVTDFRPVPLHEYVVCKRTVFTCDGDRRPVRALEDSNHLMPATDTDGFMLAVWEAVSVGNSVLVFCPSKMKCEVACGLLTKSLPWASAPPAPQDIHNHRLQLRAELELCSCNTGAGLDKNLADGILVGVAFHHSGLTTEERDIVERGYRSGAITCLTCTSTLAAGVNLPAQRVVFRTPFIATEFLDTTRYRQMSGRAGRSGHSSASGESYVICSSEVEKKRVTSMAVAALPPLRSALGQNCVGLQRLLLEVMATAGQMKDDQIMRLARATFLDRQLDTPSDQKERRNSVAEDFPAVHAGMKYLLSTEMVHFNRDNRLYMATPLGRAVCASGLSCEAGIVLWEELKRLRNQTGLCLEGELHLVYLATPWEASVSESLIDWNVYAAVVEGDLNKQQQASLEVIGISMAKIQQASIQGRLSQAAKERDPEGCRRVVKFYSTLLIWALMCEIPIEQVIHRFGSKIGRGLLQSLISSASAFTSCIAVFCGKLRWRVLESVFDTFAGRLSSMCHRRPELLALSEIPKLSPAWARQLYDAGFVSPKMVAGATPQELQSVLRRALPRQIPDVPEDALERLIKDAALTAKEQRKQKLREAREVQVTVSHRPIPEAPPVVLSTSLVSDENDPTVQPRSPVRSSRLSSASMFTPSGGCGDPSQVGFTPATGYNDVLDPTEFLWASQRNRGDVTVEVDPERLSAGLSRLGRRSLTLKDKLSRSSAEGQALSSMHPAKRRRLTAASVRTSGEAATPDTSLLEQDIELTERRRSSVANPRDLQQRYWMMRFLAAMPPLASTEGSFDLTDVIRDGVSVLVCQPGVRDSMTVMWLYGNAVEYAIVDESMDELRCILESTAQYKLIITESAADFWRLLKQKIPVMRCSACTSTVVVDPQLMSWLRNPEDSTGPSLEKYVKRLSAPHYLDRDLKQCLALYTLCAELGRGLVQHPGLLELLVTLEAPTAALLVDMETTGLMVTPSYWFHWQGKHARYKIQALEVAVREAVGRYVALGNAEDVSKAIFDDLGVPVPEGLRPRKVKKNGHKIYAVDQKMLMQLEPPERCRDLFDWIIEHRRLSHALSKYAIIDRHVIHDGLRVHTVFSQTGTATGRLKSTDPNLLTVENAFEIADVCRPSVATDFHGGQINLLSEGTDVFASLITAPPPAHRAVIEGRLVSVSGSLTSADDIHPAAIAAGVKGRPLAEYWSTSGWPGYDNAVQARRVPQCTVQLATGQELVFPADQVFRQNAAVTLTGVDADARKRIIALRDAFVAPKGRLLLSVDYCQLEARLLAHFCGDPRLIALFNQPVAERSGEPTYDIFIHIASTWLSKPLSQVTDVERNGIKQLVYGVIYGMGARSLSREMGVTLAEGEALMNKFNSEFPRVREWTRSVIQDATREGASVPSILGRPRHLAGLGGTPQEQARAQRQAVNTTCQASAADIMKAATLKVATRLMAMRDENGRPPAEILLQIHDELLLEVDEDRVGDIVDIVVEAMVKAVPLTVKLQVNFLSRMSLSSVHGGAPKGNYPWLTHPSTDGAWWINIRISGSPALADYVICVAQR
ncbi:hypothetical protein FOZ62_012302, partial [Perkinsus olseni]